MPISNARPVAVCVALVAAFAPAVFAADILIADAEEEALDSVPAPRRRFVGVPTHAVSVVPERRRSPRP